MANKQQTIPINISQLEYLGSLSAMLQTYRSTCPTIGVRQEISDHVIKHLYALQVFCDSILKDAQSGGDKR